MELFGRNLISGTSDGSLRFWDLKEENLLGKIQTSGPVYSFKLLPEDKFIVGSNLLRLVKFK